MVGRVGSAQARAAAIAEFSLALAELTEDTARLEAFVVERIAELVGDAAALWRKADGELYLAAFAHPAPDVRAHIVELSASVTHSTEQGVLPHAWDMATPVHLAGEVLEGWVPLMQPAYQEYVRSHGMVSLVIAPLRVRGETVALLGVSRDRAPEHDPADVEYVAQMGAVAAVALDADGLLQSLHRQVAEQRRLRHAAQRAALHDPLTGLPNRRVLVERLQALSSDGNGVAALLLVDLDGFKHVNDFYGHAVGDGVLVEVAARLSESLPESAPAADVELPETPLQVPAGGQAETVVLVRLAGDEFAVLVTGVDSVERSRTVAEGLLASLQAPLLALEGRTALSASVGIAAGPAGQAEALLHRADIAMYRAKRTGGGWRRYEPSVDAPARTRLRDVGQLQQALQRDELVLRYQPVVPRAPHAPARQRLEALVRWQHPARGLLPPADFLSLSQSAGLLPQLTARVLDCVLRDLQTWQTAGLRVQVSVNVGADTVAVPGLAEDLLRRLSRAALEPSVLSVELTESELAQSSAAGSLQSLREAGIAVAIDDFGTGYSSLAYLADLPLDTLKLDRAFVRRLTGDDRRMETIVAGLVDCAHRLELEVVAEGVEGSEQSARLDALGVAWQQGFLFSRPLPVPDATRWLEQRPTSPAL
jgi:predicted signal transduction protein with EAL and GGDEF domain